MKPISFHFQPVIIIGAARSGTNMLRDMLTKTPNACSWPCDEINYIWRHGNAGLNHDELTRSHARPSNRRYIRRAFARRARWTNSKFLVEKTCANSLRVDFVQAVIPEAKFIFLVRDGRDVVASALKRWKAKLDVRYVLKKARYVPASDLAYYATRYAGHRFYRLFSRERRLSTWGPRFLGMREMLAELTLEEVCAAQWSRSVQLALQDFGRFPSSSLHCLTYEDLVAEPRQHLGSLCQFLNLSVTSDVISAAIRNVRAQSVGRWQTTLTSDQLRRIEPWLQAGREQFDVASHWNQLNRHAVA